MESYRNEPERRLGELLRVAASTSSAEDDIRLRVVNLIESLVDDRKAELEVGTETGAIDILFGNVLIETKKDDARLHVAPDWARRDQHSRRQHAASQLQDYVNERYRGAQSGSSSFTGYTTNGLRWCRWEVTVGDEVPTLVWEKLLDQATLENAAAQGVDRRTVIDSLFNDLVHTLQSRPGPPDDLQQLLADLPEAAYELATQLEGQPDFEIKKSVWSDLLRGAFVLTPGDPERERRLFATHSILVDVARKVAGNVAGESGGAPDSLDSAFYSWIYSMPEGSSDRSGNGLQLRVADRIGREINRYNWKLANSDVLKGIYHSFIPAGVRHDFGEYYTPDWLAEAICGHVLDDAWCRTAVERAADPSDNLKGCGLLEPSCGSGTFLRAAVRRLIPFAEKVSDSATEQADIICRLVHALDLHPVAVELAKATMLSALPAPPTLGVSSIRVHLADTLRWVEDTDMRLLAADGILINVPGVAGYEQRAIVIPSEVVRHSDFASIIEDVFEFQDDSDFLMGRLKFFGLSESVASDVVDLATQLGALADEGRNHVWKWYVLNVAQAHILHRRRFDRIVGNPPWITRKDLVGDRQDRHREQSVRLGIWAGGANLATQNNLAALFVATVARDYTTPDAAWKFGFVLPWSALRADAWEPFRRGRWNLANAAGDEWAIDLSENPWDMKGVADRPFPQSDSCVVFGRSIPGPSAASIPLSLEREVWQADGISVGSVWSDMRNTVVRQPARTAPHAPSDYVDLVRNGANMFPKGLLRVDPEKTEPAGQNRVIFATLPSRKGVWKDFSMENAVAEAECLQSIVFPEDIAPFRVLKTSVVAIPPRGVILSGGSSAQVAGFQHFGRHWFRADQAYRERRSANGPATLIEMVDHMGKLTSQVRDYPKWRLVYPKSGSSLFGTVVDGRVLVDNACYYINVSQTQEADYVCAILVADSLQATYRESRNTDRHFDKHPWRCVPIAKFDPANELHSTVANLGLRATAIATEVPVSGRATKMRDAIRVALREDGVMDEIDRCARELLPDFAEPAR